MSEIDLYPDIMKWFTQYLKDRYKKYEIESTFITSRRYLDDVLRDKGILIPEAVGLKIKVDIVGFLTAKNREPQLAFVEVKDENLTLKDLGQLWGYTKLINPVESFLVSSTGIGALEAIVKQYRRHDILQYGHKNERMMKIAKWDIQRKSIDYSTLLPKL
ncbi:hypothetical protein [Calidifontibacillus oryziterrae]|uniref:hypothetical protein n=1 Tax=Calidifontibacillus oryziterrae TaxID=1191699 RepID=UPI0002DF88B8|nr:hypothetical protein [Calidifontibacillus oryziterrae]